MNEDEVCKKCKGIGAVDDFFQNRVEVPKNPKQNQRVKIQGRETYAVIYTMPSKKFRKCHSNEHDVRTTLQLTALEAKEGGFFEVETLHGKETVYVEDGTEDGAETAPATAADPTAADPTAADPTRSPWASAPRRTSRPNNAPVMGVTPPPSTCTPSASCSWR